MRVQAAPTELFYNRIQQGGSLATCQDFHRPSYDASILVCFSLVVHWFVRIGGSFADRLLRERFCLGRSSPQTSLRKILELLLLKLHKLLQMLGVLRCDGDLSLWFGIHPSRTASDCPAGRSPAHSLQGCTQPTATRRHGSLDTHVGNQQSLSELPDPNLRVAVSSVLSGLCHSPSRQYFRPRPCRMQ